MRIHTVMLKVKGELTFSCALLAPILVAAAIAPSAYLQNAGSGPRLSVVDLTTDAGFSNEPSIAVNPLNPQQVVAAYQVNATVAFSGDAGEHWAKTETAPADYATSGDVSITYDSRGHAVLCYIAFDKLGTSNYWGHNATRNGIFVRRSFDGGKTWEAHEVPVFAQPTVPGVPFEDKPYIVADVTKSAFTGNLYVGWTEFRLTETAILFSRSTDGGSTWSKPIDISDHHGFPRDDNGAVEGFDGTVTPDGVLHVVWSDGDHIIYTRSLDGGVHFEPTRVIMHTGPAFFQVEKVERSNGFPQIASDRDSPAHLYITWSDYRNGDVDVFSAISDDGGQSWSSPIRVNSDPVHNGCDQFLQWLAVDPVSGAVNVVFYDRRGDPANVRTAIYLARSEDKGRTFVNYPWTKQSFDPQETFLGDYNGIAAYGGRVYGIWAEQRERSGADSTSAGQKRGSTTRHSSIVRVGIADFVH